MIICYEFIDFREVPGRASGGPRGCLEGPETRKSEKKTMVFNDFLGCNMNSLK